MLWIVNFAAEKLYKRGYCAVIMPFGHDFVHDWQFGNKQAIWLSDQATGRIYCEYLSFQSMTYRIFSVSFT